MIYDVLVVGAGPAGLHAAMAAAEAGAKTLLLERMDQAGRKLMASGSGQCNITHTGTVEEFLEHYGSANKQGAARFLKPALYAFSNTDLEDWMAARGLPLETTEAGKLFPRSRRARDVRELFINEAREAGTEIKADSRVLSVERAEGLFVVHASQAAPAAETSFQARCLVLACGGASWPATGSSGDGCAIARSLGQHCVEEGPALAPAIVEEMGWRHFVSCAGIALRDRSISLHRNEKCIGEGAGDVLFTHRGLSGPGILDLSRDMRPGDTIRIPLAGDPALLEGPEHADEKLRALLEAHGKRSILRIVSELSVPETLARALLEVLGIDSGLNAASLSRAQRRALAEGLARPGQPFLLAALGSWNEAMATRGGVDLAGVNAKTMESRSIPGLFFAGEVLDYDGDTGGYNIQAAISTGRLAGASAAKEGAAKAEATGSGDATGAEKSRTE